MTACDPQAQSSQPHISWRQTQPSAFVALAPGSPHTGPRELSRHDKDSRPRKPQTGSFASCLEKVVSSSFRTSKTKHRLWGNPIPTWTLSQGHNRLSPFHSKVTASHSQVSNLSSNLASPGVLWNFINKNESSILEESKALLPQLQRNWGVFFGGEGSTTLTLLLTPGGGAEVQASVSLAVLSFWFPGRLCLLLPGKQNKMEPQFLPWAAWWLREKKITCFPFRSFHFDFRFFYNCQEASG